MVQRPTRNNIARGGVELKSNRESFGTWEALVFFSFSRVYVKRYVAAAASVSVNSEWVVSESPVGVVTRPAISVIGGSPCSVRSCCTREIGGTHLESCNRQNIWRSDVYTMTVSPRCSRGHYWRRARNRAERKSYDRMRYVAYQYVSIIGTVKWSRTFRRCNITFSKWNI